MAQEPHYAVISFGLETRSLQQEAISEVLTLTPGEKQSRLGSYGLTPPCRALSKAVVRGMTPLIIDWANSRGLYITDVERPMLRPEAFRLQKGCSLWPTQSHTAVLMPLSNVKVRIDLLPRGSNKIITFDWDPNTVIHLNEMGIRLRGNGSVRFIYILFQTIPLTDYAHWSLM